MDVLPLRFAFETVFEEKTVVILVAKVFGRVSMQRYADVNAHFAMLPVYNRDGGCFFGYGARVVGMMFARTQPHAFNAGIGNFGVALQRVGEKAEKPLEFGEVLLLVRGRVAVFQFRVAVCAVGFLRLVQQQGELRELLGVQLPKVFIGGAIFVNS
ncbi:hypothetical protein Barb6XT_02791 [Bacteroidales bacterium Barb6XT]|nr:hypothetical protein Barb6XT_02791 [Bacteroidales bacterium Barb6XT]